MLEEKVKTSTLKKYSICLLLRSEEHTSELQSQSNLVCRLLLEKKNKRTYGTFLNSVSAKLTMSGASLTQQASTRTCAITSMASDMYACPTHSILTSNHTHTHT